MLHFRIYFDTQKGLVKPTEKQMQAVEAAAAGALEADIKAHFISLGGRSFYAAAADSTAVRTAAGTTQVVIGQRGIHLQWKGGTVTPSGRISDVTGKPIRRLLIPEEGGPLDEEDMKLSDLPYARKATVKMLDSEGDRIALVYKDPESDEEIRIGTLVHSVRINPHPRVMLTEKEMMSAIQRGAKAGKKYLNLK